MRPAATETTSSSTYALAYSSGRHFVTVGNRLHLVYSDGEGMADVKIQDFSTRDGVRWSRKTLPKPKQTHVVTSAWVESNRLHVACVSREGTRLEEVTLLGHRELDRADPPWSFEAPNGSSEGIVFRRRMPQDRMRLMVRWPYGFSERITTDEEESRTAAGTSGQLHLVGQRWVVLWSGATTLNASWRDAGGWKAEIVDDEFCGVHDVSAVVVEDRLWVAYLSQAAGFLTVRSWHPSQGWSDRQILGSSEVHSVCLWSNGNDLFSARVIRPDRRIQVLKKQDAAWVPAGQPIPVFPEGSLWICGTSFRGKNVLAWTEAAPDGVKIKTAVVLETPSA